jgi:hypothetical protein
MDTTEMRTGTVVGRKVPASLLISLGNHQNQPLFGLLRARERSNKLGERALKSRWGCNAGNIETDIARERARRQPPPRV